MCMWGFNPLPPHSAMYGTRKKLNQRSAGPLRAEANNCQLTRSLLEIYWQSGPEPL